MFYKGPKLIHQKISGNSFLLLFVSKVQRKSNVNFFHLKITEEASLSLAFSLVITLKSYCFQLIWIVLPNIELFKNVWWYFSKSLFVSALYLAFELVYGSNHML